jgi:membrane dipeptidase
LENQQLHDKSIIIDGLNASLHSDSRVIKHLHEGGVTAVNATVAAWHDQAFTINAIENTIANVEYNKDIAKIVYTTSDIFDCKKTNKVGYILGFQGSMPIGQDLGLLKEYYDMGLRIIQLTYNETNFVGSGCMVQDDKGLTDFGKELILELNRLGILIDLSHCGYETTRQAIEYSEKPVAFTHANPHFICNVKRNKPIALFELLIKNGGVAGAVGVPALINCNRSTTLGDYIEVIDRMVQKLGIDNIALGPDFMEFLGQDTIDTIMAGIPDNEREMFLKSPLVYGLENATKFNSITNALKDWGYSDEDVQKILGLNWLRIYEEVW